MSNGRPSKPARRSIRQGHPARICPAAVRRARAPLAQEPLARATDSPQQNRAGPFILDAMARTHRHRPRSAHLYISVLCTVALALALAGCGGSSDEATGADFSVPESIAASSYNADAATGANGAAIDTSSVNSGYVGAAAENSSRLKFLVSSGQSTCAYDLPQDGTPIVCPLTYGDGSYSFRVMQNTSGDNYVELTSTTANVSLTSEFDPFLVPNVYCSYSEGSDCVAQARKLAKSATNQGEAVESICQWIVDNVEYDNKKAAALKQSSGYVPNPDETLASKTGICFDYASLGAAMLRSVGIPTKIVTGYVSPDSIYHAWIMVYIDGTWTSAQFSVEQNTWSRVDLTFAASGDNENVGDGKEYTDRYVY